MRGITLYSAKSGLEVMANDITKKGFKYGAITLRFFKLENGTTPLKFIMSPIESYSMSVMVAKVFSNKEPIKLKKVHKFEREEREVETTLTLEKWVKENKVGYAVAIQRDNTSINVPMDTNTFMYLGELLRYFSTQQAWVNPFEPAEEEGTDAKVANFADEETTEEDFADAFADVEPEAEPDVVPEPEPTNNTCNGVIEAVRKDQRGFKLDNGQWYSVNDNTKLLTTLKRGEKVRVEYKQGNSGILFANVVSAF